MANLAPRAVNLRIAPEDFRQQDIHNVLPSHFLTEYPNLITFLEEYYVHLETTDEFVNLIYELRDARNPDLTGGTFINCLKAEFGSDFPNILPIDNELAVKIFYMWYRSKGTEASIESFFRIFLNTEATVIYPRDNMLRASDGNWSATEGRFLNFDGHLSDNRMVIQDSEYYQIFSYVIQSGKSIRDWGPIHEALGHPAGWVFFAEVILREIARFRYIGRDRNDANMWINVEYPEVPGFQALNLGLHVYADMAPYVFTAEFANDGILIKCFTQWTADTFTPANRIQDQFDPNFWGSAFTVGGIAGITFQDYINNDLTTIRRPARILIE